MLADRQPNKHTQTCSLQYFTTAPAYEVIIMQMAVQIAITTVMCTHS